MYESVSLLLQSNFQEWVVQLFSNMLYSYLAYS